MLDGEDLLRRHPATRARYAPLFDLGARLLQFGLAMQPAGSVVYRGPSPEIVPGAILALFTMATKTFRGIHHLGSSVLSEPAVMLLRPLSECWASLGYIVADPIKRAERAEWYLIGEATEKYKWARQLRDARLSLIPPEALRDPEAVLESMRKRLVKREAIERGEAGAEDRAEKKLQHMLKTRQWADVGNEEMYDIAERWAGEGDEEVTYVTIFKMASGVLHARQPDMFMKLREDGILYPNLRADPTYLPFALFISNLLYISVLSMVIEVFDLRWRAPVKGFFQDLRDAGKAAKTEDGRTNP